MASEWFDKVTGSNDYERQSWRDSSNGGRAAGDWTGNINARLDYERAVYQGATWSGSSSQPSALQLAQSGGRSVKTDAFGYTEAQFNAMSATAKARHNAGLKASGKNVFVWGEAVAPGTAPILSRPVETGPGPGSGSAVTPGAVQVTSGPGVMGAATAPGKSPLAVVGPQGDVQIVAPVPGPGGNRRQSTSLSPIGVGGPLKPKIEPSVQQMLLGNYLINPNPRTSNAEEWEIRYAEPGEFVGGLVVMGSDIGYNARLSLKASTGFDSAVIGARVRDGAARIQTYVREEAAKPRIRTEDYAGKGGMLLQSWTNDSRNGYITGGGF